MAARSGIAAQLGIVEETTFATYLAASRFLEFNDEGVENTIERIDGAGLRAGQSVLRSDRWEPGASGASGSVTFQTLTEGFGLLFEHALGNVSTANPQGAVYQHTFTLGDQAGMSLGVQIGRPDINGTVQPFSYVGGKIASFELSLDVNGILMFTPTFDFVQEDTGQTLETASYSTTDELLVWTGGQVQIADADVNVSSFSVSVDNALNTDRRFLRTDAKKLEQYCNGMREITGTLTMEFEDLSEYNRFVNGTEAEVELTCTGASELETGYNGSLVITLGSVRFDGSTPTVGGPEQLELTLPFRALDDGTNEPITMIYTTTDTTP